VKSVVAVQTAPVVLLQHFSPGKQSTGAASSQLIRGTFLQHTTHVCADCSGIVTYNM
jgi:hypothetical protein